MASVGERAAQAHSQQHQDSPKAARAAGRGLTIPRIFSTEGRNPFDLVEWDRRTAAIKDERGRVLFEQTDCEIPTAWSQLATNVVVSKYFYGEINTPERETSVRQLIDRVTRTIADWGREDGLFATAADADAFYDELTTLCLNQYGSFNSPVWFNVGLFHRYGIEGLANNWRWDDETRAVQRADSAYKYPQGSACFIQSVGDDMDSIMKLAHSEAMLFKFGSGTGTDLSSLRSSREKLSGGGRPSGPVSFMRVYDAVASVVKSGGKTRRAAKMQTLKIWHPDILDFIECKTKEEKKAQALIRQGYEANFNGEAYSSVLFQNANLTVRVTDAFLRAVEDNGEWTTRAVTTGRPMTTYKARELMDKIAEGTWLCGDPGMQYEDTIQRWHTCPNTAPINSSNPCSEYMFLDDSACNLSSLNLMKFRHEDGSFDVEKFRHAVKIYITAQEILVDHCSYPTERIAGNSHKFRPLGLGYANLGSLLMSAGYPYDSNEGRALAGAITAIMHGQANRTSAEIAAHVGPFDGFALNREPMLRVMEMHRDAVESIDPSCPPELVDAARKVWDDCLDAGRQHGYRNAQVTVIAPTGTIAFMMDCDTTGIEPDMALVKYKNLAGGGMLKIVNRTVPMAMRKLGYDDPTIQNVLAYIDTNDTIEGAPGLNPAHLPVFDCAFPPARGSRSIAWEGHVGMMAAAQPFLSGAISKTVNMPRGSTVEDIEAAYLEGWKLGLKALAIYRDGSKESQPVGTSKESDKDKDREAAAAESQQRGLAPTASEVPVPFAAQAPESQQRGLAPTSSEVPVPFAAQAHASTTPKPRRERLPDTRHSMTHKFDIQGHEGYLTVGFFADGRPGELFITMAKEGSTVGGLMDTIGTLVSMGLQYGVPLDVFVNKFAHSRFEPAGFTRNPEIPIAKSITDYIFRWLGIQFVEGYRAQNTPNRDSSPSPSNEVATSSSSPLAGEGRVGGLPADDSTAAPTLKTNGHRKATAHDVAELTVVSATPPEPVGYVSLEVQQEQFARFQSDAPACDNCGALTVRCGTCYRCFNCGNSMGCS